MRVLVTGAAGFIGMHLSVQLLKSGHDVFGLDNLSEYYDISLKKDRLKEINKLNLNFHFINKDLIDANSLNKIFKKFKFDYVVHLAAQAGVRYSIDNPEQYVKSNLVGFFNILEACRHNPVHHFVFASSSSVYGNKNETEFLEEDDTNKPVSFYGATKKSNEIMAYSYASLYKIPITGLRFFTVYGPWGRPDMAPFIFTKAIKEGKKISIFNSGNMKRDFTYIDDIIFGIEKIVFKPKFIKNTHSNNSVTNSYAPSFDIFNIGNTKPININEFIFKLEHILKKKADKEFLPMQNGDVKNTFSNITKIQDWVGFEPKTNIDQGLQKFINWYEYYYG